MKKIAICITAILLGTTTTQAATVRSKSGATAQVADAHAGKFQCLINHYDQNGAPIRFMGGFRHRGSVANSKHPAGAALDINQFARNRNNPPAPRGATGWAQSCGLFHGALWRNADAGHFEVPGGNRHRASRRGRSHRNGGHPFGIFGRGGL